MDEEGACRSFRILLSEYPLLRDKFGEVWLAESNCGGGRWQVYRNRSCYQNIQDSLNATHNAISNRITYPEHSRLIFRISKGVLAFYRLREHEDYDKTHLIQRSDR